MVAVVAVQQGGLLMMGRSPRQRYRRPRYQIWSTEGDKWVIAGSYTSLGDTCGAIAAAAGWGSRDPTGWNLGMLCGDCGRENEAEVVFMEMEDNQWEITVKRLCNSCSHERLDIYRFHHYE